MMVGVQGTLFYSLLFCNVFYLTEKIFFATVFIKTPNPRVA